MAAPTKKRAVEDKMEILDNDDEYEDEGDSDDIQDDEDEEMMNEEIQVEFEARNSEDSDFHGIKKLMQQLFLKANINLSELTDTIISQNYVGSVIKQVPLSEEDDDDDGDVDEVFGIVTVVNLTERKEMPWVKQIRGELEHRCHGCSQNIQQSLNDILYNPAHQVGFIISERFINIPAQVVLPFYESLWKEVERAKQKGMKYDFTHYLLITKTYRMPEIPGKNQGQQERIFVNTEEATFCKEAQLVYDYSVKSERDTVVGGRWDEDDEELDPFRTIMVIPSQKLPAIMDTLRHDLAMPT